MIVFVDIHRVDSNPRPGFLVEGRGSPAPCHPTHTSTTWAGGGEWYIHNAFQLSLFQYSIFQILNVPPRQIIPIKL